jgi:esterase
MNIQAMKKVNERTPGGRVVAAAVPDGYFLFMDLAFRELGGTGSPIVILHGLFGSSQNWAGMGRRLAARGAAYALDLRNHGDSPHSPTHGLSDCVGDLHDWARAHAAEPLRLIGHSMGGLVAMGFALAHPDLVAGVAAVDIAPRPYPRDHEQQFRALHADLGGCRSRADLDTLLSPLIPDLRERQFLLMNAVRDGTGFTWRCNVDALEKHTVAEDFARVSGRYDGAALLLACGRSPYVREEDAPVMRRFFPLARIASIPQADHWPHVTAPAETERILVEFLDAIKSPSPRQ